MPPNSPQNVDQKSSHHQKQSFKSRTFDPLATSSSRGKTHSKPSSKAAVIPQDGATDHSDLVSQCLPSNTGAVERDVIATLQDAHHFSIGGNARIVNIGQQVNNRGTYGLDNLGEFVSFSALHDSSAQDPERRCHPGTRRSVLDEMRTWMDDPNAPERILWLHGPAGVGKSAIAQTISNSYDQDKVGATFFFFRSDPIRNDGNRLMPTLAWQLAFSVPAINDLVSFSLEKYPDLPRKAIEVQFDRLIAQPFLTISGDESCIRVIIIDGLDECSDVKLQRRILKLIENAVSDPRFPLRFVISSRPEAHIKDFFSQFRYPTLQIDLANVDGTYRDIEIYFKFEFARIAVEQELGPEEWPGQRIIDILVSQSSGQFIYASTTIKYVGDEYESAVARLNIILGLRFCTGKSPFAELDALYTEILHRQPDPDFLREFLPVLVARRMLDDVGDWNLDDAMLLGLDEKELLRKLRGMHSLLKFEPFITSHHKSFLDFLLNSSRSGKYHISKHFANRRYMQLITDVLVKAASNAIEQPNSHTHEGDHFKPKFATVIKNLPLPIELPLDDLEDILQPLLIIQEKLLQLPNMSVPWKPRACNECWTFYMIDDLLLHLAWCRGAIQFQEPMYVGLHPLTGTEEQQSMPQLDLDACLSLLLSNLRGVESSLNVETIGLVRALIHFDPTETAMKVRSMTDAQNLVDLIFCLNKKNCFKSWFGVAAHNATRLALALYGRAPVLPRSLFLNSTDLNREDTYQGKAVKYWGTSRFTKRESCDDFIWGNLSHDNITPLLGICSDQIDIGAISPSPANGTLLEWRQSTHPSTSQIQQIVFGVAKAIQYVHSLDIVIHYDFSAERVFLDSDNQAKVYFLVFLPNCCLGGRELEYNVYDIEALKANVHFFGILFHSVLFNDFYHEVTLEIRPEEPEIPDNVWQLIQWCCAKDPKDRPTMDQVVQEMESWISLGQFTLSP